MRFQYLICLANCQNSPTCQNSGFVAHNCVCMCPPELTGSTCDQVETDAGNSSRIYQLTVDFNKYRTTVFMMCPWNGLRGLGLTYVKFQWNIHNNFLFWFYLSFDYGWGLNWESQYDNISLINWIIIIKPFL